MLINALDYVDAAAAIAAASDGDRVYFPSTHKWHAPEGGLIISRNIEIFGDGAGNVADASGTTFLPATTNLENKTNHVFVLSPLVDVELQNLYLHDFKITVDMPPEDGANGIHCETNMGQKKSKIRIEGVVVLNMDKGVGICMSGLNAGAEAVTHVSIRNSSVSFCRRGVVIKNTFQADLINCAFVGNQSYGCYAETSGIGLYMCGFDGNCVGPPAEDTFAASLTLVMCHIARVDGCHFENIALGPKVGCLLIDCGGSAQVSGCYFVGGSGAVGIKALGGGDAGPIYLGVNRFSDVTTMVDLGDVPNVVVSPVFSESPGAVMALPSTLTGATGALHIKTKIISGDTNVLSGVSMAPSTGVATANLQDGMLNFDRSTADLFLRRNAAWEPLLHGLLGANKLKLTTYEAPFNFATGVVLVADVSMGYAAGGVTPSPSFSTASYRVIGAFVRDVSITGAGNAIWSITVQPNAGSGAWTAAIAVLCRRANPGNVLGTLVMQFLSEA